LPDEVTIATCLHQLYVQKISRYSDTQFRVVELMSFPMQLFEKMLVIHMQE